jgi:outer membrane protein assembly factor BamB/actin-like ATPase involved in cell morphogenesis
MGYGLGVDLGTTHTAAAVSSDGRVDPVRLGGQRSETPSLVFVHADGAVLVGEAAERRGLTEPGRLAREFKRRIGDPVPIMLGGSPYSAHALTARLLRQVVDTVTQMHEGPPEKVVVTHPANWGPYKRELLQQAVKLAEVSGVTLRSEPEAAAVRYAGTEHVAAGETVAVYDLGGGTFDAAVLRKTADGFELLGEPEGIEQLGGIDFDEAVLEHVRTTLGSHLDGIDPTDDRVTEALRRLRRDCVEAKETLSYDTEAVIAVALPNLHTRVRINRSQFESMIAPALEDTVAATRRALRAAKVEPGQLRCIVLAGGSARIPMVSELLSTEFERPIVLDPDPELGIALGAAVLADPAGPRAAAHPAPRPATPPPVPATAVPAAEPAAAVAPADPWAGAAEPTAATTAELSAPPGAPTAADPPLTATATDTAPVPAYSTGTAAVPEAPTVTSMPAVVVPADPDRRLKAKRRWALIGAGVAVLLAAGAGTFVLWDRDSGGSGNPNGAAAQSSTPAGTPALNLVWQAATGQPPSGQTAVSEDQVFVAGKDGTVRALSRTDGSVTWSYPAGAAVAVNPQVVDGKVFATSADGVVHAIDAATGERAWFEENGTQFDAAPAVVDGMLFIGGRDKKLYGWNLDGQQVWQFDTDGEIRTSPVAISGMVYATTQAGSLWAVIAETGKKQGQQPIGQVAAAPTLAGEQVCMAADGVAVQCVRIADGVAAPKITPVNGLAGDPVGGNNIVVAAGTDGIVTAWDATSAQQLWRFAPTGGQTGPGFPTLVDGVVYTSGPAGQLAALDATTGEAQWEYTVPDTLASPVTVDGGLLYAVGQTGTVYALQLPESATVAQPPTLPSAPVPVTPSATTAKPQQQRTQNNPPRRTTKPATTPTATASSTKGPSKPPAATTGGVTPPVETTP